MSIQEKTHEEPDIHFILKYALVCRFRCTTARDHFEMNTTRVL